MTAGQGSLSVPAPLTNRTPWRPHLVQLFMAVLLVGFVVGLRLTLWLLPNLGWPLLAACLILLPLLPLLLVCVQVQFTGPAPQAKKR